MIAITKSAALVLVGAGLTFAGAALANEAAMEAAMQACSTGDQSEQEKQACEVHALAMHQSMQAAKDGSEGVIHLDFDDSNDSEAQKSAKQGMYSALQTCEDSGSGGASMGNCRLQAFHQYQEAIGR